MGAVPLTMGAVPLTMGAVPLTMGVVPLAATALGLGSLAAGDGLGDIAGSAWVTGSDPCPHAARGREARRANRQHRTKIPQ
jgi:hypothetical protein